MKGSMTEKKAERARRESERKREAADRKREKTLREQAAARERELESKRKAELERQIAAERKIELDRQKPERKKAKAEQLARLAAEKARIEKLKAESRELKRKARAELYKKLRRKLSNSRLGFDYENFGMTPRIELTATGDPGAVSQKLSAAGIKLTDFRAVGGKMRFKIRKKELRKAIALLDGICYNYETGDSYGLGRAAAFWLARAGLVLGAVAASVCTYLSYSYIWRIDVSGNDKLSSVTVERALKSAGFHALCKKSSVDCEDVAAAVNRLDGVADASARVRGTTLYVYVLEAENTDKHKTYSSYVSDYDATVTRVVVRKGTARVSVGDVIAKNTVLADGSIYSTSGEVIGVADCDADVYGNVSAVFTAKLGNTEIEYKRTGRSCKKTSFGLFGYTFGKTASPYTSYESETTSAKYDMLIPLSVTNYRYYETEPGETPCDVAQKAESFAAEKAEELKFTGDFKSSYTVSESSFGLYTVHVFLSGEALISRGVE